MTDKELVRKMGEQIGFGNMMHLASLCWKEMLLEQGLDGGEFAVGPCVGQTEPCVCVGDERAHCNLCAGCGWLTKQVKSLVTIL